MVTYTEIRTAHAPSSIPYIAPSGILFPKTYKFTSNPSRIAFNPSSGNPA